MRPPATGYMIYLMIDPRDMLPFYAGMTSRPAQRWNCHNSDRASAAYDRLQELRRLALKCRVRILALNLTYEEARAAETQAIANHRKTLLNRRYGPRRHSAEAAD